MTDKKLTDEDIISSLEVISTTSNCIECKIRNCKWGTCNCSQITANAALDLINRQKSEIERLESANDEKFRQWDMLAEKTKQHYADLYNEAKDILKSKAYKEFAEKLKEKIGDCHIVSDGEYCGFDCGDIHRCIDNFLKEMVGEDNA